MGKVCSIVPPGPKDLTIRYLCDISVREVSASCYTGKHKGGSSINLTRPSVSLSYL